MFCLTLADGDGGDGGGEGSGYGSLYGGKASHLLMKPNEMV